MNRSDYVFYATIDKFAWIYFLSVEYHCIKTRVLKLETLNKTGPISFHDIKKCIFYISRVLFKKKYFYSFTYV